jgi:hypothetical protein
MMEKERTVNRWQTLSSAEWGVIIGLLLIIVVGLIYKYTRERPQPLPGRVLSAEEAEADR